MYTLAQSKLKKALVISFSFSFKISVGDYGFIRRKKKKKKHSLIGLILQTKLSVSKNHTKCNKRNPTEQLKENNIKTMNWAPTSGLNIHI